MATAVWRYVLTAFALFALFVAVGDAFDANRLGDIGITYTALSEREGVVNDVLPKSTAARAGVRSGDRILAPWLRSDAVFKLPNPLGVRAGDRITFYDATLRRNVRVIAQPLQTTFLPSRILAHVLRIFVLILALMLAWGLPSDRAARALSAFFLCYELQGFANSGTFAFSRTFTAFMVEFAAQLMLFMLVLFACWFPNRHPRDARRSIVITATAFTAGILVLTATSTIYAIYGTGRHAPNGVFLWSTNNFAPVFLGALLLAAIVIDFRTSSQTDRLRLEWLAVGTALLAYGYISLTFFPAIFLSFGEAFTGPALVLNDITDIAGILCITYAFLKYRVLDLTFAISRATVYALLSSIIVAAFVLVEFLVGKYVERQSHLTGAIITLAFALAIGIGFRTLHRHVDRLADRLIFRSRYRAEEALRMFGRRASFFTNERGLQETTVAALTEYARAQSAAIYLADSGGDFTLSACCPGTPAERISREDALVLALKDERRPQIVPRSSSVDGELAFPMFVRGELMGFTSCGKRRVRETYAPDEVEAMNYALEHVGVQLDAIRTARLQSQLREVRELAAAYQTIGADPVRVLAQILQISGGPESGYEENPLWKTPTRPDGPSALKTSSTT